MQEVKRIFHEKYRQCGITQRPEYKLGTIERPTVYSVDCIFNKVARIGRSRCDEFVFFNLKPSSTGIYLVERKDNHSNDVIKVKEQLQGGAKLIENFLYDDPATEGQRYEFSPVWVSKGIKQSIRQKLSKHRVSIRSMRKPITHKKVGATLPKLA